MKKAAAKGAGQTAAVPLADTQPLRLEGELSIYRAAELKPLLLTALSTHAAGFDLSEVTEIDTAGVQLLLLARREAAARGAALRLIAASPAVRGAFALLELDGHLEAA